jgi:AcrR family transcriptional regulator
MARETGVARQRIIDTATELLQEAGYEGFSLRKLAERLGQTAAAVYIHFADKDALLRAVLDQEFAIAAPAWFAEHPLAPDAAPRERLLALTGFYLAMGLGNPVSYRIRFFHDRGADAQIRDWAAGQFAPGDNARQLRDALAAWLGSGWLASPQRLALAFIGLWAVMHGLILALAPVDLPLDEKVRFAQAAVETHLGGLHA